MVKEIVAGKKDSGPYRTMEFVHKMENQDNLDPVKRLLKILETAPYSSFKSVNPGTIEIISGTVTIQISIKPSDNVLQVLCRDIGYNWRNVKIGWWNKRKMLKLAKQILSYLKNKAEKEFLFEVVAGLDSEKESGDE
jgi:hypothetical protein